MGQIEGSTSKSKLPSGLEMSDEERLTLVANLILEIITEEKLI